MLYCRFLSQFENEIYSGNSPIWREDFISSGIGLREVFSTLSPAGSSKTPTLSLITGFASVGKPLSLGQEGVWGFGFGISVFFFVNDVKTALFVC